MTSTMTLKGTLMTAALTLLASPALADGVLDPARADGLLTGNTVYLALPEGSPAGAGEAPMFYGADGRTSARLPNGLTLVGEWRFLDDGSYCVDWENGPKNSCSAVVKSAGAISMTDTASGSSRGTVTRIVPGNPEAL